MADSDASPEAAADRPAAPASGPGRPGWPRQVRIALLSAAAAVLLLIAVAVAAVWWGVRSESGTAWLLSHLPGVQASGVRGRLLGDFESERLVVDLGGSGASGAGASNTSGASGARDSVTLTGFGWRGLRIERGAAGRWHGLRVVIADLHASRVDLRQGPGAPSSGEPRRAPADLGSPIEVELQSLRIDALHADALGESPLRDLRARLHIGANAGTEHRLDLSSLAWDRLQARGSARIATGAPFDLSARIDLDQDAAAALPAWQAQLALAGPLAAPVLQATVRAQPADGKPAQSLDARATLRPFAPWPLGDLQASARALDVSAFSSAAPATALDIEASATSTGLDQPASVALSLVNTAPGRWNEGRLPLRNLKLVLGGRPDDISALDVTTFEAELGTLQRDAGRISGAGRWSRGRWNLDALLAGVEPAQLDARAAPMRLGGSVAVVGSGFAAATATATATAGGVDGRTVELKTELSGQVDGIATGRLGQRTAARPVRLELDASLNALRIELRSARATAGGARATLAGLVTRTAADAPWQVAAETSLVDFDPAVWVPGGDDSAWRRGPHRLNAAGKFDFSVPADAAALAPAELLAALRGQAGLSLTKSLLAGVPLSGEASWRNSGNGPALPLLRLDLDGNAVRAEGRVAISGNGAADAWSLNIAAPALGRLAPIYRLLQPAGAGVSAGAAAELAGALTVDARATGRWPALSSNGELAGTALRVGSVRVQQAQARWRLGTSADAAVELQASLTGVASGPGSVAGAAGAGPGAAAGGDPSVELLQLTLSGTGRAHDLKLRATTEGVPPAWTDAVLAAAGPTASSGVASAAASAVPGAATAAAVSAAATTSATAAAAAVAAGRTVALVRARGGLIDLPAEPLAGWRGTLQQIDVRGNARGAPALLATNGIGIELQWAGGPSRATLQPGRAVVLGAGLRWSQVAWQAAAGPGTPARIDAEAELEPIAVAPLLARLQPDFGWGGDLALSGRLNLKSTPSFTADIVLERSRGDLSVTDETGRQSLGLTDLRLALNASGGVWNFTQALAGKTVGVAAGAVTARTSPQALWPAAETPIEGTFEIQVANLGTWGTWVPAGWRLDGTLRASASIGGRFGAPEYTGSVAGSKLGVRNFLQGVNVTDGELAIALRGNTATIERFVAKAGSGSVELSGDASLGAAPRADLKLTATRFQLLGRVDRSIIASGQARLLFDRDALALDGKFNVDEGLIDFTRSDAPALSDDVVVMRGRQLEAPAPKEAAAPGASTAPPPPPTQRKVALDLGVTLGEQLRVRGRGLDTGLRGELRITSPDGRLAVNGTVSTAGGTYAAYGQKLTIDRGLIIFTGLTDNPRLDIEATRSNTDIRVGVQVAGTTLNPRIRLFSEPEMSDIDKLSWLVMGRASDGLGRADTALLQRAALALLSGEGPGLTDQLTKAIGLDELSVRQSEGGDLRDTVISLGKQISRRWYVGYEQGLNATGGSWQLIYRIAQRFTLRAQTGVDNSLDLIWTWRWQ